MAEYFRGQPPVRFIPNGRLIDFLQAILAGLDVKQTVGDVFTPERLVELGAEFDLADWGQLYCMIRGLKESRPKASAWRPRTLADSKASGRRARPQLWTH
jgi:hypothetical protein